MLEKTKDFHITGLKRFWYIIKSYMQSLFPFFLPTLMILIETIFILDMVGVTGILPMYLGGVPPQ